MIRPQGFTCVSMRHCRAGVEVFHTLKSILKKQGSIAQGVGWWWGVCGTIWYRMKRSKSWLYRPWKQQVQATHEIHWHLIVRPTRSFIMQPEIMLKRKKSRWWSCKTVLLSWVGSTIAGLVKQCHVLRGWPCWMIGWMAYLTEKLAIFRFVGDDIFVTNTSIFETCIQENVGMQFD